MKFGLSVKATSLALNGHFLPVVESPFWKMMPSSLMDSFVWRLHCDRILESSKTMLLKPFSVAVSSSVSPSVTEWSA